jgi:hypothetical protein
MLFFAYGSKRLHLFCSPVFRAAGRNTGEQEEHLPFCRRLNAIERASV